MKKNLIYIPALILIFGACNPMDEVYDELDAKIEPYKEDITYTMLAEDYSASSKAALKIAENAADSAYAKAIASDNAFNQKYNATDFIAPIIGAKFPALNAKSTALVTYNNTEKPEYILAYETANEYVLSDEDYINLGGEVANTRYFYPSQSPDDFIPGILADSFPNAVENDYVLVGYNYADADPVGGPKEVKVFADDFETATLDKWNAVSVTGDQVWIIDETHGVDGSICAKVSGYDGAPFENEDWLITPALNLAGLTSPTFSFMSACNYSGPDMVVKYSSDYNGSGDPTSATWTDFSGYALCQGAWEWTESGDLDLTGLGSTLYIAFVFESTDLESKTYEIDNVSVTGMSESRKSAQLAEEYLEYNKYYQFDGSAWSLFNDVVPVQPFEYDAMGTPGKYNNFSSSDRPENYLPQLLAMNFPFAQEGSVKAMVYKYYNGSSTAITANEWAYTAGQWQANGPIVEKSGQFIYAANGWVFDPTVHLSPTASDLQLLVDYVYSNLSRDYGSKYANDEFYYGASAYYLNFDLRLSNKATYNIPGYDGLDTDAAIALSWTRVEEGINIMLGLKYPDAVPEVSGLTVYYWVTFATYEDDLSKKSYTGIFKFTSENGFERDIEFEDQMVTEGQLTEDVVNWNR